MIETLMEEIKPSVIEKSEFDNRDVSKLLAFLQFSHYQHSDERYKKEYFSNERPFSNRELSFEPLMKKRQSC